MNIGTIIYTWFFGKKVGVDEFNKVYVLEYIRKRGIPVLGIPGDAKKGIVDYIFELELVYFD